MAYSRLKAALDKLRGTIPVLDAKADIVAQVNVPPDQMRRFARIAARMCTQLCRRFIIQNMSQAGVVSSEITKGINNTNAAWSDKQGAVFFRLAKGLKREDDKRKEALYIQCASLDAGRVNGAKSVGDKAKRSLKAGVVSLKTLKAQKQTHYVDGKWVTYSRKAIDLGAISVVRGRDFWFFFSAQKAAIQSKFRETLAQVLARKKYAVVK